MQSINAYSSCSPKLEEELNNNFQNLINIKEISNIKEAVDYSLSV